MKTMFTRKQGNVGGVSFYVWMFTSEFLQYLLSQLFKPSFFFPLSFKSFFLSNMSGFIPFSKLILSVLDSEEKKLIILGHKISPIVGRLITHDLWRKCTPNYYCLSFCFINSMLTLHLFIWSIPMFPKKDPLSQFNLTNHRDQSSQIAILLWYGANMYTTNMHNSFTFLCLSLPVLPFLLVIQPAFFFLLLPKQLVPSASASENREPTRDKESNYYSMYV